MKNWMETRNCLFDRDDKTVLVVSHRGCSSSSVIENTSLAFLIAIEQGADMVEMDLDRTKDGILVGHHDKNLNRLFHNPGKIADYTAKELKRMDLHTYLGGVYENVLETFEEILKTLKDRTLLMLDRCWNYWDQVYEELKSADMTHQAILKFYIENDSALQWAGEHPDCMYVPMLKDTAYLERVASLKDGAPVPALEILPEYETDAVYQQETFDWLYRHKIKVCCNSLSLSKHLVYGAGNDDLKSLRYGGDYGWGRLVKQGVNVIQTDWPYELKRYLKQIQNLSTKQMNQEETQ